TTMLILILLGVGEFLSIISKARIPMLLVVTIGYLILIWTGVIPKDMLSSSVMSAFGSMMVAPLIVHMGTLVPFKLIKQQIKSVVIALSGIIVSVILVLTIVPLIFDYSTAVAGIGPLTGGTISFVLTVEKLKELDPLGVVARLALILAKLSKIRPTLAGQFLRRQARHVNATTCTQEALKEAKSAGETSILDKSQTWIPKKYQTNLLLLLQIFKAVID